MSRAVLAALAVLASCAESDERPLTVEYVTEAVLAPSCGNAQCHSSFRQAEGITLDTVDAAKRELVRFGDITLGKDAAGNDIFTGDPDNAVIIQVLTRAVDRMPYDQPLPENEIEYLRRYIEAGSPGAQCLPEAGDTCAGPLIMSCQADASFGDVVEDCRARPPTAMKKWTCSAARCLEIACTPGPNDPECNS